MAAIPRDILREVEQMPNDFISSRPEDIVPLSIEEYEMAWRIAYAAAAGQMPMKSPAARGTVRLEHSGKIEEYRFGDTVTTRIVFAVRDHFGIDDPKCPAFLIRDSAMRALDSDPRWPRWVREDGSHVMLFEGLFEAAAALPLHRKDEDYAFDADEFFAKVEAVNSSGKYRHTGELW